MNKEDLKFAVKGLEEDILGKEGFIFKLRTGEWDDHQFRRIVDTLNMMVKTYPSEMWPVVYSVSMLMRGLEECSGIEVTGNPTVAIDAMMEIEEIIGVSDPEDEIEMYEKFLADPECTSEMAETFKKALAELKGK